MSRRRFANSSNPPFDCRETAILVPFGRESYFPAMTERLNGTPIDLGEATDRIVVDVKELNPPVSLVYSGMGGPAAANAVEMIAANGGRRVVVFGACGGVDPGVNVGDLVIPTAAIRGDGASAYYAPSEVPAVLDPDLGSALWGEAHKTFAGAAHRGIVVTTDASYRQGPEIYDRYAGLAIAVDCECSTVAIVGLRLDLAVGGLLFCTDNVRAREERDRSYRGPSDPRIRAAFESGLDVLVAALGPESHGARENLSR